MRIPMILLGLFLSFGLQAKVMIFTDIDDTIKQSNVLNKLKASKSLLSTNIPDFPHLKNLFVEIAKHHEGEEIEIYYVSGSIDCFVPQKKWLKRFSFMPGTLVQRKCKKGQDDSYNVPTQTYKVNTIAKALQALPSGQHEVYLFGDNGQHDAHVYKEIQEKLPNFKYHAFVRDIGATAFKFHEKLPVNRVPTVGYFLTEIELMDIPDFQFLSADYKANVIKDLKDNNLFASYLDETLAKRLNKEAGFSKKDAKSIAQQIIGSYYAD